jgi:hypothetical protein
MRPPDPLTLVVPGHAALLAAVDLHVGGVQVDRDRAVGQRKRPLCRQHRQHPPGHHRHALLDRLPLRRGEPAGQARRGRGRQPRHRRQLLPSRIGTLPVQPGQEVLPGPEPPVPLLERAGCRIQRPDHAQPPAQLADHRQTRVRRQRRIRRADPDLPLLMPAATYPAHQIGALSTEMIICLAAIIIPGQSGTYRHLHGRVTGLLADSCQTEYLRHYNTARPHRALGQLAPVQVDTRPPPINVVEYRVRRKQVLGGLISE